MTRNLLFQVFLPLGLLAFLAFYGCIQLGGLKSKGKPIHYYTLNYPAPGSVSDQPVAGVLRLRIIKTASLYSTNRMVTEPSGFSKEFYTHNLWAVNPASLITDFLYRDLAGSGLFEAVQAGAGYLIPDYEISGNLESFQAIKGTSGWEAVLTVNMILFPYSSKEKLPRGGRLMQKTYTRTAPCKNEKAERIVEALSACMEAFSRDFLKDLEAYLESSEASQAEEETASGKP